MYQGKLVFAQLMALLPLSTFARCVDAHKGDHKVKDFSCLDLFLAMAFAQLTWRESLRDIEVNLRAQARRLYHMGFRCSTISRNTLSNANATRPWQIYADFAQHLIAQAKPLYASEPLGIDLNATVYAFDASTIDLCLSVFAWAPFRQAKAAIKLHTLLDLRGNIPSFLRITDGKTHEVNVLDDLTLERGAFYFVGSGLSGLCSPVRHHAGWGLLCDPSQEQYEIQAPLLTRGGQAEHIGAVRSNGCTHRLPKCQGLPTGSAPHRGARRGRRAHHVPDQQLLTQTAAHCRSVPPALAGRTLLQMDQAAPAHQGVLWAQRERGQNTNLDRHLHLRADRDCTKTLATGGSQHV